jgi:hypothetical protein
MTDAYAASAALAPRDGRLGPLVVHLLRGVIEREIHPRLFEDLLRLQAAVADYVGVIGLELHVDEAEGHAFLRQRRPEDGEEAPSRLVVSRPLGFHVSLLCVLLRKKLVEADAGGGEPRVILRLDQIVELMRVFMPARANEAKVEDQIEQQVKKVVDLGFLRPLRGQEGAWEVRRIIKAFVDAEWLASLDEKLVAYRAHLEELDA